MKSGLSQGWLAAAMGISEPLLSAQLSDHNHDKHLSLRRLGRAQDVNFWREFALLILEDLGMHVVVQDSEQKAAQANLLAACADYTRAMGR